MTPERQAAIDTLKADMKKTAKPSDQAVIDAGFVLVSALVDLIEAATSALRKQTMPKWRDFGVTRKSGGKLIRVPGQPLAGQYAFDERTCGYTVHADDFGQCVATYIDSNDPEAFLQNVEV